jgi:hypothetical protein
MCKGNDIQGKVEGSRSDRTVEPGKVGSMEAQTEVIRSQNGSQTGRQKPPRLLFSICIAPLISHSPTELL